MLFRSGLFACTDLGSPCDPTDESNPLLSSNAQISTATPTMHLSPYKMVLNAKNAPDIGFVYSGVLPSGYSINSFDIAIYFDLNPAPISFAHAFRYCAIDNNFLGQFDRAEICSNTYVQSLKGQEVLVYIKGSYIISDALGHSESIFIDKWDFAEIK